MIMKDPLQKWRLTTKTKTHQENEGPTTKTKTHRENRGPTMKTKTHYENGDLHVLYQRPFA